ncbi:phosphoglycerate kinase [Ferroacidibacillus organovorans]|uniref:Phosphoglycerate kinase n=1 Tax=Ferroacidibacillus organovorans TaxID=1765683 RepID=A0A853K941_9BACL|nr:phosphoglycerate kinase [Ferroacidibacillus organovorans]KYP80414.1 phosphoglycerate kinase [Ferroacidibacillus organovorans]OAG93526.1 phosphoglycerate kinase [Ferroacidibacillus organovorans]
MSENSSFQTLSDVSPKGLRLFVRADFNVPMEHGVITDDTRIRAALPTIRELVERGGRVILASHLGRPKGREDAAYSLAPVAARLAEYLKQPVSFCPQSVGAEAQAAVGDLRDGEVLLLENVRFHAGEEKNDPELARRFAELADLYVNDAFGAAHRAHASTAGIANHLRAVAGRLMERELNIMGAALQNPERPFTAIIGGAKVSDKIKVIENLLEKVDRLLIGGGMANTFLLAQGYPVGKSLVEAELVETARALIRQAASAGKTLLLPTDLIVATRFAADADHRVAALDAVGEEEMALDIGPDSINRYRAAVATSRTVIWNGPMGVFEMAAFSHGTLAVAQAVADVTGTTIIGGGDSVAAIEKAGLADRMTHISTGGGASLEFLEGRALPGVESLARRSH